jgi:hypothetical protein
MLPCVLLRWKQTTGCHRNLTEEVLWGLGTSSLLSKKLLPSPWHALRAQYFTGRTETEALPTLYYHPSDVEPD